MPVPVRARLRLVRAACVGGVVLALAAGAHVVGHGDLPHPVALGALAVLVGLVAAVVTRRRLGLPTLLAGLHQAMVWLAVPACGPTGSGAGHLAHTGAQASAHGVASCAATTPADHGPVALMTVAHVVATVLAAVVLATGERALWTLLGWLRPALVVGAVRVPVVVRYSPAPAARILRPHRPPVLGSLHRRGPPVGAIAAG